MTSIFQSLGLKRDAWSPDYSSALQFEGEVHTRKQLRLDCEVSASQWQILDPQKTLQINAEEALNQLGSLVFMDGVRRLHQRLVYDQGEQIYYGGLGSVAVGALQLHPGQMQSLQSAQIVDPLVQRYLLLNFLPEKQIDPELKIPGVPHPFQVKVTQAYPQSQPVDVPAQYLQQCMREQEQALVKTVQVQMQSLGPLFTGENPGCILVDGPLFKTGQGEIYQFGYIKSLHTQYLPAAQQSLLYALRPATRSPIFALDENHWSWYQRLHAPQLQDHPLSAVVRLEVFQSAKHFKEIIRYANLLTLALPLFTLTRLQDPRSPQNLAPVQFLERHLKRLMGNTSLIQRRIEAFMHEQSIPV